MLSGTLCHLVGLRDRSHAAASPMAGAIMETAVVSEIVKTLAHRGIDPQIRFWRTSAGAEVDVVVEWAGKLVPVEVKLSATPSPAMARGIEAFRAAFGSRSLAGYVVHPGEVRLPLGPQASALPFAAL